MLGININCKEAPYVDMILDKHKVLETRNTDSLRSLVGQRVGLVETGKGKAMLKGYATIEGVIEVNDRIDWDILWPLHLVPHRSKYDFNGQKFCYILSNVKRCTPTPVHDKGNVKWRKVPDETAARLIIRREMITCEIH